MTYESLMKKIGDRDVVHFELRSLHPMDYKVDREVLLEIRVVKRFLWFKWIKVHQFRLPKENLIIGQEMQWYLYGTERKYR